MIRHGLIREEIDILQGRIPQSMFIRNYWSPSLRELGQKVLNALTQLEMEVRKHWLTPKGTPSENKQTSNKTSNECFKLVNLQLDC